MCRRRRRRWWSMPAIWPRPWRGVRLSKIKSPWQQTREDLNTWRASFIHFGRYISRRVSCVTRRSSSRRAHVECHHQAAHCRAQDRLSRLDATAVSKRHQKHCVASAIIWPECRAPDSKESTTQKGARLVTGFAFKTGVRASRHHARKLSRFSCITRFVAVCPKLAKAAGYFICFVSQRNESLWLATIAWPSASHANPFASSRGPSDRFRGASLHATHQTVAAIVHHGEFH